MFGFFFGALCLIGLISVIRRGRRGYYGRGCHGGRRGWGHHGHARGRGRGHGGGMLYGLFERLDTTPGQEKAIREAVDELVGAAREMKGEAKTSAGDIARVIREQEFDVEALGTAFSRQDDKLRELQKAFAGALARIHDALDDEQRKRLAGLLESVSGGGFGGWGPYRGWV